jgi:CheY-like chemotaxis protein
MNATRGGEPFNILLVEDDDGDAKAVRRAFAKAKVAHQILRAVDGVEALDMMRGTAGKTKLLSPYVMLVDLNLPRMNGIQLVKALRADDKLRHAVVLVLSTTGPAADNKAPNDQKVAR